MRVVSKPSSYQLARSMGVLIACLIVLTLSIVNVQHVQAVSILVAEPDDFPVDTNLTTAFTGIILSRVLSSGGTDSGVFARDSAQFTASTGDLIFGHAEEISPTSSPRFSLFWAEIDKSLRVNFLAPALFVAIDVFDLGSDSRGVMKAFDSSGTLLETFITDPISGSFIPVVASISRPVGDISYITVTGLGTNTVLLDHLTYSIVPEPSTLLLLASGLAGLAAWRRRKAA